MRALIYDDLVRFYPLLDPLEDHADEAEAYGGVLLGEVPGAQSLLELGAGAGHGAHYIKRHFTSVTLTDLSSPMLGRSRTLNPDCEHRVGDMRTLRLGRTFDCVLCHDAVAYMLSESDLRSVLETAWAHLRPGGAALFVPDALAETFVETHEDHAGDDGDRSLRAISWSYDPDPSDTTHVYDFAFLLREGGEVRAVHDRHVCGLFPEATWVRLAESVGFEVATAQRPLPAEYADSGYTDTMFVLRRRGG
ncbi:MAG: class I SAM-dependent methyltransferase [Nannocystaceae bacterium]|nr:class I SAM-dependent methyltransferase [bacterium]